MYPDSRRAQKTLFSHFTIERMKKHLNLFHEKLWQRRENLPVSIAQDSGHDTGYDEAQSLTYSKISEGEAFSEVGWNSIWFKVVLPEDSTESAGAEPYLLWLVNGESTVYIDGVPWCGLDTAHRSAPLPNGVSTLYIRCGTYQSGLWMRDSERKLPDPVGRQLLFYEAALAYRDSLYWPLYHDLKLIYELAVWEVEQLGYATPEVGYHSPLDEAPPFLRRLLSDADTAMDLYDTGDTEGCAQSLRTLYNTLASDRLHGALAVVGNSHLDLVWLWPERITREKNIHTCSTILRLMERYPTMKFTMSQPWLLDALKEESPELYRQIHKRIDEGRWELTGGMYVEADTLLPCGEGLVRSFTLGQELFMRETGKLSEILWLPDTFGYSQCMPQIARAAGIRYFYTTKLLWSAVNRFPYTSFIWEGLDGSSLVSHVSQVGYEARATVKEVMRCCYTNRQAGISDESLLAIGFGDGGGGPTDEECERVDRLNDLAILPQSRWSRADEFFDRLEKHRSELPVYHGELYLEYHRGTYTTMHLMKQAYRDAERALQILEAAAAVTGKHVDTKPLWNRMVFMQFHDALPGSSIQAVYDQMIPELVAIRERALTMARTSLGDHERTYTLFNPHGISGSWLHEIDSSIAESYAALSISDEEGTALPTQRLQDGSIITQVPLKGLEGKRLILSEAETVPAKNLEPPDACRLQHDLISVLFDDAGSIAALTIEGESVPLRSPARFMLHADIPANFDAWEIDHPAVALGSPLCAEMELSIIEHGPLLTRVRGETAFGEASSMAVSYSIVKDSPYLFISVDIDWQEEHTLLRYEIPTRYAGMSARFGAPFGSVDRPCNSGPLQQEAQWEEPASRWIAVTDGMQRGLAVITSASYGFSVTDGIAGISLLRSPCSSDEQSIHASTLFAEKGRHTIEFAIGLYRSTTSSKHHATAQAADTLYTPPIRYSGGTITPPWRLERQGSLVVSWVTQTTDNNGYIIRLHEASGRSGSAELHLSDTQTYSVHDTDLLENRVKAVPNVDGIYIIDYTSYCLLTVMIEKR